MRPNVTMREALHDPALLGNVIAGPSWSAWRAMLLATVGEKLAAGELETFTRFTGRTTPPSAMVDEAAFVIGRRGGKDRATSVLATYLAALCDHSDVLARGERGVLLVIAPDQRQAKVQLDYIAGVLEASPILTKLVEGRTADNIELSNRISVEVRAASFRRLRGVTAIAIIATEAAFWFDADSGSTNADDEILNAVRPSLATTGGPLVIISSPYAKRGELWNLYRRHYGPDGDPQILVAQGASRDFNPTLSERIVKRALARDRAAASAEYLAEFRADIESFVSIETVERCIERGVRERAPVAGTTYYGFCDPSGGSSDSMTLAVGHRDGERIVIDATRERRAPFSPEDVVEEFVSLLKLYRVSRVEGDRYAGEWPAEQFRKRGVTYTPAEQPKSDLYRDLLPMLNAGSIVLLDDQRAANQLAGLERRTARSGKDSIDHSPGGRDDLANAIAGVAATVTKRRYRYSLDGFFRNDRTSPQDGWKAHRLHQHLVLTGGYRR